MNFDLKYQKPLLGLPNKGPCDKVFSLSIFKTTMQTAMKLTPVNIEERKKLNFKAGDTVRVLVKIQEKGKTRLQAFEGLVIARKHGGEQGATFTVRKISNGVGVERIFPLFSPNVDSVETIKKSKTRRSKLYFLRDKTAKEIRRKLRSFAGFFVDQPLEIKAEDMQEEVIDQPAPDKGGLAGETPKEETASEEAK